MSQEQKKLSRFEETVLPHLDAAFNLARWIMNNDQDAEDMVQEAYLRAYKYFNSYQGMNSRAWLLTIVRNTCYSWLRKNRENELAVELDEEIYDGEYESHDPEALFQARSDHHLVRSALEALPAEFREVMILRELEDFSYKEIANITGIPMGTVMSRLARAHKHMKQVLVQLANKEGENEL